MLEYFLFLVLTIFIFFNKFQSNIIVSLILIYILFFIFNKLIIYLKSLKETLNNKTTFDRDNKNLITYANKNFYLINNISFSVVLIATPILFTMSEYVVSRYFKASINHIFIFALTYPLFLTLLTCNSPIYYYINNLEINYIEKYYEKIYYEKIKSTNINNTDNYNKDLLISYLEKSKNLMREHTIHKNLFKKYLVLMSADLVLISIFCDASWLIKILISYFLFYLFIFRNYDKKQDKNINELQEIIENSSNISNYIFSDFRNMIFFNSYEIKNEYSDQIEKNTVNLFSNRSKENKDSTIFMFKVGLFKRLVYVSTVIHFFLLNKLSINTVIITVSIIVINYMCRMNEHIFFSINHFNELSKVKKEYNKCQLEYIDNPKYKKFLEKISRNISISDNNIHIYNNKLNNKLIYLKGESGKGKTSILKSIVYKNNDKNLTISYLPQELELNLNNLRLKDVIRGFLIEDNDDFIEEAIKLVYLDNKFNINSIIKDLSGGEKQRVRIAKIIYYIKVTKSNILIMDEPDNNLNVDLFQKIINNIMNMSELKHIILTSHKFEALNNIKNIQIIDF